MGYSISVPLKSKKARDEALCFLREHFKSWTQVKPDLTGAISVTVFDEDPDMDWTRGLCSDGELSYDHGKHRIGFNCTLSGGFIGEYAWAVLRFIALRWGRVRKLKKFTGTDDCVPYVVYDGCEAWPVLQRDAWAEKISEEGRWCLVDAVGYKPLRRPWKKDCAGMEEWQATFAAKDGPVFLLVETAIKTELDKLEQLYAR